MNPKMVFDKAVQKFGQTVELVYRTTTVQTSMEYGWPDPDEEPFPNKRSETKKVFFQPPDALGEKRVEDTEVGKSVLEMWTMYAPTEVDLGTDLLHVLFRGDKFELRTGDVDTHSMGDMGVYQEVKFTKVVENAPAS